MNETIKKAPVFEDAETVKQKEEKTKLENLKALKIVTKEIEAMLKYQKEVK